MLDVQEQTKLLVASVRTKTGGGLTDVELRGGLRVRESSR
jgi:hypothetical protein